MASASTSANDLTRQQLDELDALLQRMLSLPINPAEPAPPPIPAATLAAFAPPLPPVNLGPPPAFAAPVPAPPVREPLPAPPARRAEPQVPAPRLFSPPAEEPARFEPPPAARQAAAPRPVPEPKPEPPPPAAVIARPAPAPAVREEPAALPVAAELPFAQPEPEPAAPAPGSEPVPLVMGPFVLFNRVLNAVLGLFGPPGRVLRSGFVKNLLGLAGLGLIAYTGAKVAQIHGWVTLPIELPWPR